MTSEELETIRSLCESATPGPWTDSGGGRGIYGPCPIVVAVTVGDNPEPLVYMTADDARFIAASRQLVPSLIDECERLAKENERLKAIHRGSRARLIVAASAADDASRCAVCGWPLVASAVDGCVRGNCFERPRPKNLYAPERAARELLKNGVTP